VNVVSDMPSKKRIIDEGLEKAITSPMRAKYCALIVKRNKIVSIGVNNYRITPLSGFLSTHAEVDAIRKCKKGDMKDAIMYVIHFNRHELYPDCVTGCGVPCKECQPKLNKCISRYGLKKVYYTTLQ